MKKRFIIKVKAVVALLTFSILFVSCRKDDLDIDPITFNPSVTYGSLTDQEGNIYKTVTIGNQTWMAENLKTTRYRNGDPIQYVADSAQWRGLITGGYCYYDNNKQYVATYGCLYKWYAVNDSRNLAPSGWHVPTDTEWATLNNSLGGEDVASDKLKEVGTTHWRYFNGATNESGFTALPGGGRGFNGYWAGLAFKTHYRNLGSDCYLWTSTEYSSTVGYSIWVWNGSPVFGRYKAWQ